MMRAKLLSLIPVVDASGMEMDQGAMMRFFNEMMWSTPLYEHKVFRELLLPASGEAFWHLEEADFSYIKLEIVDVEYNRTAGCWRG